MVLESPPFDVGAIGGIEEVDVEHIAHMQRGHEIGPAARETVQHRGQDTVGRRQDPGMPVPKPNGMCATAQDVEGRKPCRGARQDGMVKLDHGRAAGADHGQHVFVQGDDLGVPAVLSAGARVVFENRKRVIDLVGIDEKVDIRDQARARRGPEIRGDVGCAFQDDGLDPGGVEPDHDALQLGPEFGVAIGVERMRDCEPLQFGRIPRAGLIIQRRPDRSREQVAPTVVPAVARAFPVRGRDFVWTQATSSSGSGIRMTRSVGADLCFAGFNSPLTVPCWSTSTRR